METLLKHMGFVPYKELRQTNFQLKEEVVGWTKSYKHLDLIIKGYKFYLDDSSKEYPTRITLFETDDVQKAIQYLVNINFMLML